jgi:upstream activation factor subunit UAF30
METEMKTVLEALINAELKPVLKLLRKIRAHQEDPTGEKAKERATNNGFNRAQEITPELRDFLSLPEGESISRSDVTKRITAYISENGLKHPDNGRMIILDNKLMELLKPPEGVQVTFLNIQKYLSPHYIKPPKEKKLTKKQQAALDAVAAPAPEATQEPPAPAEPQAEEPPKKKVVKKAVKPAAF